MIAAPSQVIASGSTPQTATSKPTPQASAVYSNGATTDDSPRAKASVSAYWPPAPTRPTPAISRASPGTKGVQFAAASSVATGAISVMVQNSMLSVLSVRPSTRAVIAETA